jgi:hypothetical protein
MSKASITEIVRPGSLSPALGRSEHISLETDSAETRVPPRLDRAIASFELNNRARGVITEIEILEDHYVAVNIRRRAGVHSHNVDLRFVDPRPKAFRQVSWRWLYAALSLTAFTATVTLLFIYAQIPVVQQYGVSIAIATGTMAIICYLICYYRTAESLYFVSLHGRVPVIAITGNLGTFRKGKPGVAEVIRHINLARMHFRQPKAAHLRDEMREHSRLFEQGALTERQNSEAKVRILQAHA